jgi:small subunit ribosomal protein S13
MAKPIEEKREGRIVRVLAKDIEGRTAIYAGLTQIKGISWAMSNAICKKLNIDKKRKIESLTEAEIQKIAEFMKKPALPKHLMNRQNDFETGETSHLLSTDLELKNEFDVKRLKKIKSYRGLRHASNLPVRGQRTKSHFRTNRRKGSGIKKKTAVVVKQTER